MQFVGFLSLPSDMEHNKSLDLMSATFDFMISHEKNMKKWERQTTGHPASLANILQSTTKIQARPRLLWIKGEGPKELIISFFLPQLVSNYPF